MTRISAMLRAALCAGMLPLGACAEDYYSRMDTVTLAAGDAKEVNRVAHTIDPWPRAAANPNLVFNGARMTAASERYEANETTETEKQETSEAAKE